jgi:hypothetical protein
MRTWHLIGSGREKLHSLVFGAAGRALQGLAHVVSQRASGDHVENINAQVLRIAILSEELKCNGGLALV